MLRHLSHTQMPETLPTKYIILNVMKIIYVILADSWSLWSRGGPISLLLLPLKSRSGRLRSGKQRLPFLGGREAAGKGGGERLRKGEREMEMEGKA